jgi:xylulokinase
LLSKSFKSQQSEEKMYILSHDLGTTGDKALIIDESGKIIASAYYEYPTYYPKSGWAEQDPAEWWEAVVRTTKEIASKVSDATRKIAAVGLSGQMMGCLPVDAGGNPLRKSMIHSDTRSHEQAERIEGALGKDEIYKIAGNLMDPHYPSSKIAWLKENERGIYDKTRFFVQSKDYIAYKLTGTMGITDHSDASLTGLYDLAKGDWSRALIDGVGAAVEKLPEIHPSSQMIGKITPEAASQTGLMAGTPVVAGGGDGACATWGAGVSHPGEAYNYIGGTSWISTPSDRPIIDPKMRVFHLRNLDSVRYDVVGTVQCAGSAYKWLADEVATEETREANEKNVDRYEVINRLASLSPPGSNGLFFLPYLMGERAPIWDPKARGVYFGLSLNHKRADLMRSVLEGVAYALRSVLEAIVDLGLSVDTMRVIGGGAKGAFWREMMANVYGVKILVPEHLGEATSLGAAMAAGVGVGVFKSWEEAARIVKIVGEHEPASEIANQYSKFYSFYKSLYPALKDSFRSLAELMEGV